MTTRYPDSPITAASHDNPYPYYAQQLAPRPLYYDDALALWVAWSADAVSAVLTSDLCHTRPESAPVPKWLLGTAFALISNEIKDPGHALDLYRNKDLVEKAFGNLKERLSMRRMLVSSELSLEGKLFVQFVALIYLSYLKKTMKDQRLFGAYTIQGVLDQLDSIECFERPGSVLRIGEITTRQQELFQKLGVAPPNSL